MFEIKSMVINLAKFYWSPLHPSMYVTTGLNGQPAGVGLIAHNNYAAFNVVWATHPLVTYEDHRNGVMSWSQLNQQLDCKVGLMPLDFAITSKTREGFREWYKVNRSEVHVNLRVTLDKV